MMKMMLLWHLLSQNFQKSEWEKNDEIDWWCVHFCKFFFRATVIAKCYLFAVVVPLYSNFCQLSLCHYFLDISLNNGLLLPLNSRANQILSNSYCLHSFDFVSYFSSFWPTSSSSSSAISSIYLHVVSVFFLGIYLLLFFLFHACMYKVYAWIAYKRSNNNKKLWRKLKEIQMKIVTLLWDFDWDFYAC